MRKINQKAKKVVNKIISKLEDGYLRLDNSDGTYMPLSVEKISDNEYSFCHYGKQNGDLMCDPEMILWEKDGEFYPYYFRNDYVGVERYSINFENGKPVSFSPRFQKDDAVFFGTWMENVKYQQEL